ncbi:EAL domain-containing protein [Marinobacterium sediminicola]|uniref:EAL domain, c-di-GMP-specific phosphodiesterase class I (Or its enzymatically inactive variant) n=1 Tax=Marinobacterium sediminicola TaxID=518898 RepID=A0ABY1S1M8_9GAMM|nr:EAL domain-containing protein [Marinobacterium sediminicola]ULG69436.1 EAL domain-containing protein [Marinobacterium sediminicola]SMR75586.1 EAL domain, c-di-GMP-specific phosphodiesterase class I (or its enzymatically inactive variant) [Marinobacterium sediminicola]
MSEGLMPSATETELSLSIDQLDHILGLQQTICSLVASGAPFLDVINETCRMAEQLLPGSVASFMRLDDQSGLMNVVAAPSVPETGRERLQGLRPGPASGSCGNAVYGNAPTFVFNTFEDPRWTDLRDLAVDFNLCSCWSMPVRDEEGRAIGSFALSSFEHRRPSGFHRRLLEVGAALISIAVLRHAQHQRLEAEKDALIERMKQDALTGLPNGQSLVQALRQVPSSSVLILLNLNNLGLINTRYGLKAGDHLLQAFGQELARISGHGRVFRGSADEFALLYDELEHPEQELARLRKHFFNEPAELEGASFYLTFNAGVAQQGEDLLRRSMVALKRARLRGKNATHVYDPAIDEPVKQQQVDYIGWSVRLHEALQNGGIRAWFQGIRDNHDGVIRKWETLVRLEHGGEIFGPVQFLPVAELTGLMPVITRQMVEQAVSLLQRVDGEVSVNITETDLELGYLPDFLEQETRARGVDPKRLILEIHEGVSSGSKQAFVEQLQQLKRSGYQLAIDDFGTEYSNFERILELEIDMIKVDAKYIRNIHLDPTSYEIVRAIVFFARNAGIRTVAEFVHCKEVQAIVESLGIDASQGFLFSEPEPFPSGH